MRSPSERVVRHLQSSKQSKGQTGRNDSGSRIFRSGDHILKEEKINGQSLFTAVQVTKDLAKAASSGGGTTGVSGVGSNVFSGAISSSGTTQTLNDGASTSTIQLGLDTLGILGTADQGVTTTVSGGNFTISTQDATVSAKGVSSFSDTFFTVSSGAVSLDAAQTGITSLLATDIVIGEDADTKIDFETANEIHFDTDGTQRLLIANAGLTVANNLVVSGDLTVSGGTTSVSSTTITTTDSMIGLASDNEENLHDIGLYGTYRLNGTDLHTGVVWDADQSEWVIFDGAETEPTTIVNPALTGYDLADLHVGKIEADDASVLATGTTIGNLTLADGSITTSASAISFGAENLSTSGTLGAGATTVTSLSVTDGDITNVRSIYLDRIYADGGSSFSFANNWTAASTTCADLGIVTTVDINAGTVDATIGATTPAAGTFTVLTATGAASFQGTVTLGNATTDTLTATGYFGSALIPNADDTYDLGTDSKQWRNIYIDGTATVDTLQVDINATVGGTLGVTGESTLASATISDLSDQRIVYAGTSGSLVDSANLIFTGSLLRVTGDFSSSGTIQGEHLTSTDDATITDTLSVDGTMTLSTGSIVDSSGTISFDNENLITTGKLTVGALTTLNGGLVMDVNKFSVADSTGNTLIDGTLGVKGDTTLINLIANGTIDANSTSNFQGLMTVQTGIVPDAQDGAYLGTSSLQWSDLFLADGAVISFGDDNEVTLTHVHNEGLLLSSTDQLQFGDSGTFINQSTSGQLDIDANGHLELTSPIIQLVATSELDIDTPTINLGEDDASDVTLNFLGSTNDGTFWWDESYDHFIFNDDIVMAATERIYFGGNETDYIFDNTSVLTLTANLEFQIDAPTLDVNSDTTVTIDTDTAYLTGTTSVSLISGSASLSVIDDSSPDDKPEVTVNSLRIDDLATASGSGALGVTARFMIVDTEHNNEVKQHDDYKITQGGSRWSMPSLNYNQLGTQIMNIGGSQINLSAGDININSPYPFVGTPFQTPFDTFLIRYQLADGNDNQHMAGGRADYIQNYTWVGGYELQDEDYLFESGGGGGG